MLSASHQVADWSLHGVVSFLDELLLLASWAHGNDDINLVSLQEGKAMLLAQA